MQRLVAVLSALTVVTLLWSITIPSADACSCRAPAPPQEAAADADAVFFGEVTDKELIDQHYAVELDILVEWKGVGADIVEVRTHQHSATCGFNFTTGQQYLVYAYRNSAGELSVSLCSRTSAMERQQALSELGDPSETNFFDDSDDSGNSADSADPDDSGDSDEFDDFDESDDVTESDDDDATAPEDTGESDHSEDTVDVTPCDDLDETDNSDDARDALDTHDAEPNWTVQADPLNTLIGFIRLQAEYRLNDDVSVYAGPHLRLYDSPINTDHENFTDHSGLTELEPFRSHGVEVGFRVYPFADAFQSIWLATRVVGARLSTPASLGDDTGWGGSGAMMAGKTWNPIDHFVVSLGVGVQFMDYRVGEQGPQTLAPVFHSGIGTVF